MAINMPSSSFKCLPRATWEAYPRSSPRNALSRRYPRSDPPMNLPSPAASGIIDAVTEEGNKNDVERHRAAIEAIVGHSMVGDWPDEALPNDTRVHVIKSKTWDGPWRQVFTGTVDETITPRLVGHKHAERGELEYSVLFDEAQMDTTGLGPYRKAVIWARYLEPI
jgi:hypothetical protein